MTRLGYGIVSYFKLLHTFMCIFFLIACVNIPVMINNYTWNEQGAQYFTGVMEPFTVGSLGASETRCHNFNMSNKYLILSCQTGNIANITDFGVSK